MELSTNQRLQPLLASLEQGLLERDVPASVLLLGALAGEHSLLVGPPGTAKSELARRLQRCFSETHYFERLLTRFTTPEELFGPLSLKALEDDRYERLVDGFLPSAGIAFLDEVFKAHSAILNTLLGVLNERRFDNGRHRQTVPLISLVGASNETAVDDGLAAFQDRFLLQIPILPVSDAGFAALLALPSRDTRLGAQGMALAGAERVALLESSHRVTLGKQAADKLQRFRAWLPTQDLKLSDRRWRQWLKLMRVAAAADGRDEIDVLDLWTAPFVSSAMPDKHRAVHDWVSRECAGAYRWTLEGLARAVQAFDAQLNIESSLPAQDAAPASEDAGKMSVAKGQQEAGDASGGHAGAEPQRIRSGRLEERGRRRFSRLHLDARQAEIRELQLLLQERADAARMALETLSSALKGRIWPPLTLRQSWLTTQQDNLAGLEGLLAELGQVAEGFAALPQDETSTAAPGMAVAWRESVQA